MFQQRLRIKPYFQLLLREGKFDFIKTLNEGVSLPAQKFTAVFLEKVLLEDQEDRLVSAIAAELNLPSADVQFFIREMLEAGVLEYFQSETHAYERFDRQLHFFDALQPLPVFEQNFERQQNLAAAHVAVIGIGGIGNYIALSLAASGVGKISLIDNDLVERSNLSRQILFSEADLGQSKSAAAARRLQLVHPEGEFVSYLEAIHSKTALESLLSGLAPVDYLVLSADQAIELPNWASELRHRYGFKAIKCGYMGYQGLIGPIFGPDTKGYEEIFESWAGLIEAQPDTVKAIHARHVAPSSSASNAILANIACLEMLKDLSGTGGVNLFEKRLLLNLKTLEMKWA